MTAEDRGQSLPVDLRGHVMAAELRARCAGRAGPAAPEISPVEAFRRAAGAFYRLLCLLHGGRWQRPALRGLDVQGLVGHLTGVEEDVQRALAGDPAVADASHVVSTQAAAERQQGFSPDQTRAEWRRGADRTIGLVGADDDLQREVALHGMRVPLGLLLVIRAFELWVHDNDIRDAAALPPAAPDASTLSLMTSTAVLLLPHAVGRAGPAEPTSIHLVLTGPGGGTWDLAAGEGAQAPVAVGIVTDALGFCRLAANRISPAGLAAGLTGDQDRAAAVLAAVTALALD